MILGMQRNVGILFLMGVALASAQSEGHVSKAAPELDQVIWEDAKIEKLGGGFGFVEGPVWIHAGWTTRPVCCSAISPITSSGSGRRAASSRSSESTAASAEAAPPPGRSSAPTA